MATFVEYELEDGTTILVKLPKDENAGGVVRAGRDGGAPVIEKAQTTFTEAFQGIRRVACAVKSQLEELRADEVEVKFGLVSTGKLGNFAIGEVGVEANYEITLKWNNAPSPEKPAARPARRRLSGPKVR